LCVSVCVFVCVCMCVYVCVCACVLVGRLFHHARGSEGASRRGGVRECVGRGSGCV